MTRVHAVSSYRTPRYEGTIGKAEPVCIIDVTRRHGETVYGLLRHLRPIVLDAARVVEDGVRQTGWTVASCAVLGALRESGPATVPTLTARMGLARQNVQHCIDRLARPGHVTQSTNPARARSVLIEATEAGRETFDKLHRNELQALDADATECSTTDIATAVEVLTVLDRDIRKRAEQGQIANSCMPTT